MTSRFYKHVFFAVSLFFIFQTSFNQEGDSNLGWAWFLFGDTVCFVGVAIFKFPDGFSGHFTHKHIINALDDAISGTYS